MMWGIMQNPTERPGFDDIKTKLADIASETFNSTPERALQTKRAKQQALLNQLLPSKVQCQALLRHCMRFALPSETQTSKKKTLQKEQTVFSKLWYLRHLAALASIMAAHLLLPLNPKCSWLTILMLACSS